MSAICRTFSRINGRRFFSTPTVKKELKPAESETSGTNQRYADYQGLDGIRVGKSQRFFLYFGGKYKSMAEVPNIVSTGEFHSARTKARVKIANYTMVWFVIMALYNIYQGKEKRKKGETLAQISHDRHAKWEAEKSAEIASKSG